MMSRDEVLKRYGAGWKLLTAYTLWIARFEQAGGSLLTGWGRGIEELLLAERQRISSGESE